MGKHREPEQPEDNGMSQYPASGEEGGVGKRGIFVTADTVGQRSDQCHRGLCCGFIESLMMRPPLTHWPCFIHQMFVFCVAGRHLPALD